MDTATTHCLHVGSANAKADQANMELLSMQIDSATTCAASGRCGTAVVYSFLMQSDCIDHECHGIHCGLTLQLYTCYSALDSCKPAELLNTS